MTRIFIQSKRREKKKSIRFAGRKAERKETDVSFVFCFRIWTDLTGNTSTVIFFYIQLKKGNSKLKIKLYRQLGEEKSSLKY